MSTKYVLGDDSYAFMPVELQVLSHYKDGEQEFVDLCLSQEAYAELKEYFRMELSLAEAS